MYATSNVFTFICKIFLWNNVQVFPGSGIGSEIPNATDITPYMLHKA
jgi:hypothetical protein